MENSEIKKWVKEKKLLNKSATYSERIENVFRKSLAAKDEKILIITDFGLPKARAAIITGYAYYLAAKKLGLNVNIIAESPKAEADPADLKVVGALDSMEKKDIVIMNVSNKLGEMNSLGKSFRQFARKRKLKFISGTGLGSIMNGDMEKFVNTIDIDYGKLQKIQAKMKRILDSSNEMRITTEKGTDLYLKINKDTIVSNNGDYTIPGHGGNIPCGEVYLAPKTGTGEGVIIIDGSSRNNKSTEKIKKPIKLKVENGKITEISGGKEAKLVESSLRFAENKAKYPERVRSLAEIGFGFNPNAEIIGAMIVDEKTKNTCHAAIGSNYWFGGDIRTIIHLDQVFKNPKVELDGKYVNLTN